MQALPRLSECRDCKAPIRFVKMTATGRALPVDPKPDPAGTVAARLGGGRLHGFVISHDHRPGPLDGLRFRPHHATCEKRRNATPKKPAPAPAPTLF